MMLILLAALLWMAGRLILCRVPVCRGAVAPESAPNVSVIIPARNEVDNLPRLLASLREQSLPPVEMIVIDDDSRDRTADVARAGGARVIASTPLPAGWRGKTWACHQGANAAHSELLLFIDADTRMHKDGLRGMVSCFMRHGGVLSVLPYHTVKRNYEQLSAYFNIIMAAGVGAFTWWAGRQQPAALFGQVMLVSRTDYKKAGGHEAVKDKILENFHLARYFREAGVPLHCYGGRETVRMRMYPNGINELIEGWTKAFADGAAHTPLVLLALVSAWLAGGILAAAAFAQAAIAGAESALWAAAAVYALYVGQLYFMTRQVGSYSFLTSLLYPAPLIFYLVVFIRSAVLNASGGHVMWKGRDVDLHREEP